MLAFEPAFVIRSQSAATLCMIYKAVLALGSPLAKRSTALNGCCCGRISFVGWVVRVSWKLIGYRDVDVIVALHQELYGISS